MPKTEKGRKIMRSMKKTYGEEEGEHVFYASANKGTIKGIEKRSARSSTAGSNSARKKRK